ncbi:longitudinals lacking protein, isoforms A/B/D/L-like isoform X4 [Ceratina calcarata]|uniref:Longitudinals lacking protein, isoforms A/B/D/L-like isoform X4 n=1 Tax=Ceratina calcarata TaxID=156304 RepID=A0AAJ7NBK3_9HYME|nr:longitudinals lacking protein, isoforms A/B/D/L-like isoform X4 [Ceratina calcarata]
MEDDQQFCLRWNNHQTTLIQNFDTLLESGTLVDCTLAAEGKYLKAHKVVLSACSPYFEGLLSEHYDKHPVFILKDVKFKELKAMMDYMYRGEVNISQDQLAALLKAAESLQIKGLSESRTGSNTKTDSRQQKVVPQTTTPTVDIPLSSSGLTIEKNKVPRLSLTQASVVDLPEESASPQITKGLSSREGSQSPTARKRKRMKRRSISEDNSTENHEASNSSDMPQQQQLVGGGPALGIAPVADEKSHADPTDSIGRSALMTQLTKPADEMLQLALEKPEPNDSLIEPKSEYLEDAEEGVEDLTLDDDMNDLTEMEQDNNRAGPSHDPSQHPAGIGSWHVTGDRSNAGGVVGSVGALGTTDEVLLAAQEAVPAHRDSQDPVYGRRLHSSYGRGDMLPAETYQPGRDREKISQKDESFLYIAEPIPPVPRNHWPDSYAVQNSVPKKKFYCPRCNSGYTRLSDMKTHCHFQCGKEPRYQCPYCTKKAKFSSNMYVHVRRMHKDEKLQIIDLYKQLSRGHY